MGLNPGINGIIWSKVLTSGDCVDFAKVSSNSSKKVFTSSSYLAIIGSLTFFIKKNWPINPQTTSFKRFV